MVPQSVFQSITDIVIPALYDDEPNQLISYRLEKKDWIRQLYVDENITDSNHGNVLEGGATLATVLECITVVLGLYHVIKELAGFGEKKREVTLMDFQDKLKLRLYEAKVDESTINRLVNEFSKDILIKVNQETPSL